MNHILGHLLYFSLADLQVAQAPFNAACRRLGYVPRQKDNSAGYQSLWKLLSGMTQTAARKGKSYRFSYRQTSDPSLFELTEESLNRTRILARISYDKELSTFDILYLEEPSLPVEGFIQKTEKAFYRLKGFANTKNAEYVAESYLDSLMATKLNVHGRLYFIPYPFLSKIPAFFSFIEFLDQEKRSKPPLTHNCLPVLDCPLQRQRIAKDFQHSFEEKAHHCIQTAAYLLDSNSPSLIIRLRWYDKISNLLERLHIYESILGGHFSALEETAVKLRMLQKELLDSPLPSSA